MKESSALFEMKKEQAEIIMTNMQNYWPYGSPYPHTPGYQPVQQTTDLLSKYFDFNKSFEELIKNESAG
jgi:hypothetical protein